MSQNKLLHKNIFSIFTKHVIVSFFSPNQVNPIVKTIFLKETQLLDISALQDSSTMYFSQIEWVGDF
jgi:hypothetical protein